MKLLTPLDLTRNEILNVRLQNLAAAPSTPPIGFIYYDTVLDHPRAWDGAAWLELTGNAGTLTGLTQTGGILAVTDNGDGTWNIALTKAAIDAAGVDAATVGGATAAQLRDRATHTGTQPASTISDFDTAVRANRLDQLAAPTANVGLNGQKVTGLADGTADTDAATWGQVRALINGVDWKASVRASTTADVDLATGGLLTVDGVDLDDGDRVLVTEQTDPTENGIYLAHAGAWTRAPDADTSGDVTPGMATFVEEGTANGNQQWALATDAPINLGVTGLTFIQIGSSGAAPAAGGGLTLAGNTYDVGAGNGILVDVDAVRVDPAVVARKYAADIGNGALTAIVVNHNLNTRDVTVQVRNNSAPYDYVGCDIEATDVNNVTVRFTVAPTAAQYRVVVHG